MGADDVVDKYDMDDYDDDDDGTDALSSMAVFASNDDDPYVTLKDADDDDEDDEILPTDSLALAAHVEGPVSTLQIHLYDAAEDHSFVHRDFFLPALPLRVEWIGGGGGGAEAD